MDSNYVYLKSTEDYTEVIPSAIIASNNSKDNVIYHKASYQSSNNATNSESMIKDWIFKRFVKWNDSIQRENYSNEWNEITTAICCVQVQPQKERSFYDY